MLKSNKTSFPFFSGSVLFSIQIIFSLKYLKQRPLASFGARRPVFCYKSFLQRKIPIMPLAQGVYMQVTHQAHRSQQACG